MGMPCGGLNLLVVRSHSCPWWYAQGAVQEREWECRVALAMAATETTPEYST